MNNNKTEEILLNNEEIKNSAKLTQFEDKEEGQNNQNNTQKLNLFDKDINNNNDIKIGKENKKNLKNVIISDNIHVIPVENWKKYNSEQNLEPNFNFINEDSNKIAKRNQKDDVKCSCLLI